MSRKMCGSKQLLLLKETAAAIDSDTYGVLACRGDAEYPYAVPLDHSLFQREHLFSLLWRGMQGGTADYRD
jgi:nitroimidazol reductase NimA-like FMN-containing flavoprotein (pyridoxamine 5'-phosphate oxidase superfamily)